MPKALDFDKPERIRIAERLLKGFAVAANIGVRELWMASAAVQDLYALARVFGDLEQ